MYRIYGNYYKPKHKYEIIDILSVKYPSDREKFKAMSFEQLFAIYNNYRRTINENKEMF